MMSTYTIHYHAPAAVYTTADRCGQNCMACPRWESCSGPAGTLTYHCVACGEQAEQFVSGLCPTCQQGFLHDHAYLREFAPDLYAACGPDAVYNHIIDDDYTDDYFNFVREEIEP